MSIKIKIILIVLPLIVATLLLTWRSSSLLAQSGINTLANDFLSFKTEILKKNAEQNWETLVDLNQTENPTYIELTQNGIMEYAETVIAVSETEAVIAFDKEANIIKKSKSLNISDKEKAGILLIIESLDKNVIKLEEPVIDGVDRVAVGFYFAPFQWYLLVTEEKNIFYNDINEITSQSMIILGISIVVSIALLWIFAVYLTKPLTKVVKTMKDIMTTNDLSERVLVEYKDETGELAHTFNLMINELEKAYNQIKSYAFKAVVAQRKETGIRRIFQRYVPKDVIDQFSANPESMLVGENRVLSILFSDIRSFTTISEGMMPDELVQSLNRYFAMMVDVIMNRNGIVDKYIGDAIMAFYGAPVKHPDDALQSVYSGLEMIEQLEVFNRQQREAGIPEFRIGIGINYGIVTVGNIGCERKMDYTVIGDMVNLASRLEGLTKKYGQGLIISESVRNKVVDDIPCRMLDKVAVKGKTKGVNIYSAKLKPSELEKRAWKIHGDAMRTYYNQDFIGSIKLFTEVQKILPDDFVADMFIQRCKEYALNPPTDWTGVEKLKSK